MAAVESDIRPDSHNLWGANGRKSCPAPSRRCSHVHGKYVVYLRFTLLRGWTRTHNLTAASDPAPGSGRPCLLVAISKIGESLDEFSNPFDRSLLQDSLRNDVWRPIALVAHGVVGLRALVCGICHGGFTPAAAGAQGFPSGMGGLPNAPRRPDRPLGPSAGPGPDSTASVASILAKWTIEDTNPKNGLPESTESADRQRGKGVVWVSVFTRPRRGKGGPRWGSQ
jgi:hypothetical protein